MSLCFDHQHCQNKDIMYTLNDTFIFYLEHFDVTSKNKLRSWERNLNVYFSRLNL